MPGAVKRRSPFVAKCHRSFPVVASIAYTRPSMLPAYTTPSRYAGDELTGPFVWNFQRRAPSARLTAYRDPSVLPTYTASPTTTGDEITRPRVLNFQTTESRRGAADA